ncbi:TetR/AcrR family transcriptional regulator [Fulvivirga maritima]|uniref:TetR/AcrR family transcriptional regulator n=1 Tax=Fulvivirga maritima TaxID=2904247 RepID=UPI001F3180A5|nr:TetR/AcrR family transcriptional regulator [Fulvivirga maritima]UII24700.1 TetR/AcrR family transcriptional regulator [Fulvivirga maritima]
MRPQKVLDTQVLEGLTQVFRTKGYEGASLQDLSEATGLMKASLYHRFPKGKQEMATAVLNDVAETAQETIFDTLLDKKLPAIKRFKKGIDQIKAFYDNGKNVCLLRALSMQGGLELFQEQINQGFNDWLDVFYKIGLDLGLEPKKSKDYALLSLVEIQGSLVVSHGTNKTDIFEMTLKNIENRYLKE